MTLVRSDVGSFRNRSPDKKKQKNIPFVASVLCLMRAVLIVYSYISDE